MMCVLVITTGCTASNITLVVAYLDTIVSVLSAQRIGANVGGVVKVDILAADIIPLNIISRSLQSHTGQGGIASTVISCRVPGYYTSEEF